MFEPLSRRNSDSQNKSENGWEAFPYKQYNFAMILYRLYVRSSLSPFTVFVSQCSYLMVAVVDSRNI